MKDLAIDEIYLDLHHWLLDNTKLTKKEKTLTIMLLCRAPHNPVSSERALGRIAKESSRTIGRHLHSLVDKGAFTIDRPTKRETHYFFWLKSWTKNSKQKK